MVLFMIEVLSSMFSYGCSIQGSLGRKWETPDLPCCQPLESYVERCWSECEGLTSSRVEVEKKCFLNKHPSATGPFIWAIDQWTCFSSRTHDGCSPSSH